LRKTEKSILLATIGALCVITLLAIGQMQRDRGDVSVALVSYANSQAAFSLTNLCTFEIEFTVALEQKTEGSWPEYRGGAFPHRPPNDESAPRAVQPFHTSSFTLQVDSKDGPAVHRASVLYYRSRTRAGDLRARMSGFFERHGLASLAQKIRPERHVWVVAGPEIR
jgi:hypothetical protein